MGLILMLELVKFRSGTHGLNELGRQREKIGMTECT